MASVTKDYGQQVTTILTRLQAVHDTPEFNYHLLLSPNSGAAFISWTIVRLPASTPANLIDATYENYVRLMWDNRGVEPYVDVPDHQWRDHKCIAISCTSKTDAAQDQYESGRYVKESELVEASNAINEYLTTGVKPEFFR